MSMKTHDFVFEAIDGYLLSARHYHASEPVAIIVLAGATGVPQEFYRRFAEYASHRGYDVLTFDYRGIGKSAPCSLKGFKADFYDWAGKDLKALVDRLSHQSLPLFYVGHSFGGHALGMLDNHHHLRAACFLGTGAGWHGWMPPLERIRVKLLWTVVSPVLTRYMGYLGLSVIGMGEDLPLGVYKQWKRWCSFPNYFFDDEEYPELKNSFAAVKTPIKAINALDDKWAPPDSRDAFMQHYTGCSYSLQSIDPIILGLNEVGHMGYFRSKSQLLWQEIVTFFDNHR